MKANTVRKVVEMVVDERLGFVKPALRCDVLREIDGKVEAKVEEAIAAAPIVRDIQSGVKAQIEKIVAEAVARERETIADIFGQAMNDVKIGKREKVEVGQPDVRLDRGCDYESL